MPTHERYALNELQLATLEALSIQPGMHRDEIIEQVQLVPGLDDVSGNAMGPCLAALKRRGLAEQDGHAGTWSITGQGRGYVSEWEGEPESPSPVPAPVVDPAPVSAPVEHVGPPAGASTTACDDQMAPDPAQHAEPPAKPDHGTCGCGRALTAEEARYYDWQCEACVEADHRAMQEEKPGAVAPEPEPAQEALASYDVPGRKDDGEKLRFDLLFSDMPLALTEVVDVLTQGAVKYAPGNWQHVPDPHRRYLAATLRHELALARGERSDPETRCHHLAHSICCDLFRLDLALREAAGGEA